MEKYNLLEICDVYQPKTIATKNFVPDGKYTVYGANGAIGRYNQYNHKNSEVIMACRGATCGAINISKPFSWINGNAMVIHPNGQKPILQKYLMYCLEIADKKRIISGTAQPQITRTNLIGFQIPVCGVEEQERIVARIEELFSELDKAVETLKTTKQQLAIYRQAVLKEAFKGIKTFNTLQALSVRIFDGPFGSNLKTSDYTDSGIRVVRLENLKNGWFDDSKQSFVTPEKYASISSHTVFPTDLIMSTFISENIKVCQLPEHIKFAVNKADCVGIRLKDGIMQQFVIYYLMTKGAYNKLVHKIHGATRPRINTNQIKQILIPVCDLKMQMNIVLTIDSHLTVCDSIEETVDTALQQAEAMRQSILKKAFEGEL